MRTCFAKAVSFALLTLVLSVGVPLAFEGCSSTVRTAYVAEVTTRTTVEAAMGLYNQAVKAGKVTIDQEKSVKAAYEKVQASMIIVCDTGKLLSTATSTNTLTGLEQVLTQAATDYAQNKADLFNLLTQLGIKL